MQKETVMIDSKEYTVEADGSLWHTMDIPWQRGSQYQDYKVIVGDEVYTVCTKVEGDTKWYQDGKLHRIGGPAIEGPNGYEEWLVKGKLHRLDGPAITYACGSTRWYKRGCLHRLNNLPAAVDASGYTEYRKDGYLHRLDGPAMIWANGDKEWYIHGDRFTEEEFLEHIENMKVK